MDLLQIEHFLAVVEERTFTRAAERVSRTQPAVSQSIKKLEDELGISLFARDGHDVSLTEAGRLLEDYARTMVRSRDEALCRLSALKNLTSGTLNIAAHESAAVYLLPAALRSYLNRFPEITVGIYRSKLDEIPRQVLDREVDVGFVADEPTFHELEWLEVHSDEMMLVAPPRHALARHAQVRIEDLGEERFVVHCSCSTTEQMLLRLFEQHNTRCRIVAKLWSFENIKNFVEAEVGLAIVPGITVRQELRAGRLVRLNVAELNIPRRTLMIYWQHGYLSEPARELIKVMRAFDYEFQFGVRTAAFKRRA
jgi:DNA-binding transcriptional LysR family regulator